MDKMFWLYKIRFGDVRNVCFPTLHYHAVECNVCERMNKYRNEHQNLVLSCLTCSDRRRVFHALLSDRMAVAMTENINVTIIPVWNKHKNKNCERQTNYEDEQVYRITDFSLNTKPYGSSEGTTSDPPIVGTLPASKQHDIFIIVFTRWTFKFLKMYFIKNENL